MLFATRSELNLTAIIISSASFFVALMAFYHNFYKRRVECFVFANKANAFKKVVTKEENSDLEDCLTIEVCVSNLGNTPVYVSEINSFASTKKDKRKFWFDCKASWGIKSGEIEVKEFELSIPSGECLSNDPDNDQWVDLDFELELINYKGLLKTIPLGTLRVYSVNNKTYTQGGFQPINNPRVTSSGFRKLEHLSIEAVFGK